MLVITKWRWTLFLLIVALLVDPAEVQQVPVPRAAAKMVHAQPEHGRRIRAQRPVERAPIVQRVGQDANRAEPGRFRSHDQGQNADRPVAVPADQHTKPLVGAKVLPVDHQPIERVEERRAGRLREHGFPEKLVALELSDVVDFFDVFHRWGASGERGERR